MKITQIKKFNQQNIKCDLQKIGDNIYLIKFNQKNNYDMCMLFCRYQEKYESPNKKIRSKNFTMLEFIEWYSKNHKYGWFTYTTDWSGFNLPNTIFKSHDWLSFIPD